VDQTHHGPMASSWAGARANATALSSMATQRSVVAAASLPAAHRTRKRAHTSGTNTGATPGARRTGQNRRVLIVGPWHRRWVENRAGGGVLWWAWCYGGWRCSASRRGARGILGAAKPKRATLTVKGATAAEAVGTPVRWWLLWAPELDKRQG
jgi:hypothetical protein